MANDIKLGENHDLVIDPITHDLEITNGLDEIAQRIQKKIKPEDKKIKELEEELLYLRAENAYLKALRELAIEDQKKQK